MTLLKNGGYFVIVSTVLGYLVTVWLCWVHLGACTTNVGLDKYSPPPRGAGFIWRHARGIYEPSLQSKWGRAKPRRAAALSHRLRQIQPAPSWGGFYLAACVWDIRTLFAKQMGACEAAARSGAIPPPPPSVPTLGTASELVRNDRLALFYVNPGPLPPLPALILQDYTNGLAAWAGFVC